MNLSPYPNFCKTEKIKSTPRILQKDFYLVYLTHQLWHIVERVYSNVILFFIASEWYSPIIVTKIILHLILKN